MTTADADDRNRQVRGDRRRRTILDAAVELFATKGYRGTGVGALAERVGMTAPGLLYYFGSKSRLLHEVVAERDRVDLRPDDLDLRLSHLRHLGRHNEEQALLTKLYVVLGAESIEPDAPLHSFFVERYERSRALVRELLAKEGADGRLRAGVDVEQTAREVLAVIIGLEAQWLLDPDRVDYAVAVETYIDRLVADITEDEG